NWQGMAEVRVERAVDDAGRTLAATPVLPTVTGDDEDVVWVNGMNGVMMPAGSGGRRLGPVGVRVSRKDKSTKRLAQLARTAGAPVRRAEPLAVVDAPLTAAGKAVRGGHGVNLTVKSISRGDSGDVTVSADVRMPLSVQLPQWAGGLNLNGAVFNGPIINGPI